MKKWFFTCILLLSLLFVPFQHSKAETILYCSAQVTDISPTGPLHSATLHIDCNDPYGYRVYLSHMGQYKRDIQVGDRPTLKNYKIYLTDSELYDSLQLEPLK